MIILKSKDFFENKNIDGFVCTTNQVLTSDGRLVMGAGIAKEFKNKFPGLDKEWGQKTVHGKHNVFYSYINGYNLFSFPTKYHWKDKSDINLIVQSSYKLVELIDELGFEKILMTKPGCGNGGLDWIFVKNKIKDILDNRFYIHERQ